MESNQQRQQKRAYDNGCIEGFVARDPELRFTPNGTPVTKFSIPIPGRWDPHTKERVNATVWVNVVCFGSLAESVAEYIKKGNLIKISGRFQANSWTTQDGQERVDLELVASQVSLLVTDKNFVADEEDTPF